MSDLEITERELRRKANRICQELESRVEKIVGELMQNYQSTKKKLAFHTKIVNDLGAEYSTKLPSYRRKALREDLANAKRSREGARTAHHRARQKLKDALSPFDAF